MSHLNLVSYLHRQSWQRFLLTGVAGAISGLCGAAVAAIINHAINGTENLLMWAGAFFGVCVLQFVAESGASILMLHLTQDALLRLRVDLSRKLLATPQKKLQALGKHRLLAILSQDIGMLYNASQQLVFAFSNAMILVGCLIYVIWLSWQLFLLLAVFVLMGIFLLMFMQRLPAKHLKTWREHTDVLYHHLRGLLEGSRELQLNSQRGKAFIERVLTPNVSSMTYWFIKGTKGYVLSIRLGLLVYMSALGILLFFAPRWVELSGTAISGIAIVFLFMSQPIHVLTQMLPVLRHANISLSKIQQLEGTLTVNEPNVVAVDPFRSDGPILLELKGVCHRYPGNTDDTHFMLGPVDLTIHQGEILFIVGGNGSGKTTFAMVLLGLFEAEAGSIALNHTLVSDANRDSYRQYFSAVFSDFHLFEHLLGEDLSGPEGDALNAQANHYLKAFEMSGKVKVEEGRFSTTNLSAGQRKRLALISSYLEDRPICLFDEWAADQDPAFKRVFYTQLLPELKTRGKTVIVITHDDAYFSCADRVIKVEEGRFHSVDMQLSRVSDEKEIIAN